MDNQTVLYRQINPEFFKEGRITSQAFAPYPKDEGGLSVYDGSQISAQSSYEHYTKTQGLKSEGAWGVSCEEVTVAGLSSQEDPLKDFPEHALIIFPLYETQNKNKKEHRKFAKTLIAHAEARGCLYPIQENPERCWKQGSILEDEEYDRAIELPED